MPQRVPIAAVVILLAAGVVYAGAASVRGYQQLFAQPRAAGPSASIDGLMGPLQIASIDELRSAVHRAGWRRDSDIVMLAAVSSMSAPRITQAHFVAGYALYPRRVWLAWWCDPSAASAQCHAAEAAPDPFTALSKHATRHVMLVASENPFPRSRMRRLSDVLSLVDVH
jgi:hypothetical protein